MSITITNPAEFQDVLELITEYLSDESRTEEDLQDAYESILRMTSILQDTLPESE